MKDNVRNIEDGYNFISAPYRAYKNFYKDFREFRNSKRPFNAFKSDLDFKHLIQEINRIGKMVKDDCDKLSGYLKEENKKAIDGDLDNKKQEYLVFITELLEEIDSLEDMANVVDNLKDFIRNSNFVYYESKLISLLNFTLYEIEDYLNGLNENLVIEFNDYISRSGKTIGNSNFKYNIYDQYKRMEGLKEVISNKELCKVSELYDKCMNINNKSFDLLQYYLNINCIIDDKVKFEEMIKLIESDLTNMKNSVNKIGDITTYLNGKVLISNYIDNMKIYICEELYTLYEICCEYYDNMQFYYIECVNKYFVKVSQVNKNMGCYEVQEYIEKNQYTGDIEALMDEIIEENIEALKELAK